MGSTTKKYVQALLAAQRDIAFRNEHPKYSLMTRERLYRELVARGYEYKSDLETWQPRQEVTIRGERAISERLTITRPVNGTFLLRIVAPAETLTQIDAELMELAEAIGWQIDPGSRNYENEPDGKWVRKYYTVRRG